MDAVPTRECHRHKDCVSSKVAYIDHHGSAHEQNGNRPTTEKGEMLRGDGEHTICDKDLTRRHSRKEADGVAVLKVAHAYAHDVEAEAAKGAHSRSATFWVRYGTCESGLCKGPAAMTQDEGRYDYL